MKIIKKNIICFVISLFLVGCVTLKPDSRGLSVPDYNQRVSVTDPHYDKVLTPIGVASITASTLSAGYAGYKSNLIRINNGADQTTSKIGNALIGATVGFGTSYLANRLLGWGKSKPANDPEQWLKKANRNYSLISYSDDLFAIPKNADGNYQIKNLSDANQFVSIFNNSIYKDDVFKTGVQNLRRGDFPPLIELFPNIASVATAKNEYIRTAPTYKEVIDAVLKYPNSNVDLEEKFFSLISTISDAVDFKKRYPESKLYFQIIQKLTPIVPRNELPNLIAAYSEVKDIEVTKDYYIKTSPNIDEFFTSKERYDIGKYKIYKGNYKESFDEALNIKNSLAATKNLLGEENYLRLEKSLAEETLKSALGSISTQKGLRDYIATITNDKWLSSFSRKYVDEANAKIAKIQKEEFDAKRREAFEIAKRGDMVDMTVFAHRYKGSAEGAEAKSYLDQFARKSIKETIKPFTHVANGDRGFWTTWAENMRDMVRGAEDYNIFILGKYKNYSDVPLSVHFKVTLNLIITTRISLFSSSSEENLTENYYLQLMPGDEYPLACIFPNISGGTTIGTNLLLSGGVTRNLASNPISIEMEYNLDKVPDKIFDEQYALIKNLQEKGNVTTKDWGGNSAMANIISGGGEKLSVLNIVYNSDSSSPKMDVYDVNSKLVKSKTWDKKGRNITMFYLPKGKYFIEVSNDCRNRFNVTMDVKSMSLTINKDCTSEEYRENE